MSLTARKKEYWKIMPLTAWKKLIIFITTSCFTNSLRKYEKDLLQNIIYKLEKVFSSAEIYINCSVRI